MRSLLLQTNKQTLAYMQSEANEAASVRKARELELAQLKKALETEQAASAAGD